MVKCNVIGCEELAPVRISTDKEYLYFCYKHSSLYQIGEVDREDLEIDFYQTFEGMRG